MNSHSRPDGVFLGRRRFLPGFTLVELMIVVIILGILAALTIPQFSNASSEARDNMLRENLRSLRMQIGCYQAQHNDVAPGHPDGDPDAAPTEAAFITQLTSISNSFGEIQADRDAEFCYGPYFSAIPENPINQSSRVAILDDGDAIPADGGWGYAFWPDQCLIRAGCGGVDEHGIEYSSY